MSKNYKSVEEWQAAFKKNSSKLMRELGKTMPTVGKIMKDTIKKRTRLGFGVEANEGTKGKLKPLSPLYKKQRKKLKLSSETSPSKSNLTLSGSMLDNLDSKVNQQQLKIRVRPKGRDRKGVGNKQKAGWVSVVRPFLYLSKPEIKRIKKYLSEEIDNIVKKLF